MLTHVQWNLSMYFFCSFFFIFASIQVWWATIILRSFSAVNENLMTELQYADMNKESNKTCGLVQIIITHNHGALGLQLKNMLSHEKRCNLGIIQFIYTLMKRIIRKLLRVQRVPQFDCIIYSPVSWTVH